MSFVRSTMIVTAAALMAVAWPGNAEAQLFRLAINEINMYGPQDSSEPPPCYRGWFCADRTDEVYFTVAGVTGQNVAVSEPYIPLPPHGSPYGMRSAQDGGPWTFRNIPLWNGQWQRVNAGQYAFFVVFVRERDFPPYALTTNVNNAAEEMRQVRANAQLSQEASVARLETVAFGLFQDLASDSDDIIAAFTVHIWMPTLNPTLMSTWKQLDSTRTFSQSSWGARFHRSYLSGGYLVWAYEISANIQQLIAPVVNRNSGKCLDVANADVRGGANVQQYACSGSVPGYFGYYDEEPNQQWIMSPTFPGRDFTFSLISVNSGLCLDVVAGSRDDGANVQQYACNVLGWNVNQQWRLNYVYTSTLPFVNGFELRNVNSGKCLDVAAASIADGGNVQQFTCHGGQNQWWIPYGYFPFGR